MNKLVASSIGLFYLYTFFVLPIFLLPISLYWALTLVPFIWLHVTHWGMIHEAIHKHLADDNKSNDRWGRGLAVLMGVSLHIVRFGHMMHHKLNREWQSEFVEKNGFKEKVSYFYHLLGGLYISEFLAGLIMAVLSKKSFMAFAASQDLTKHPDIYAAGERMFYIKENVKLVRLDTFLGLALHTAAFTAYGMFWPVLLAFIIIRAVTISFMDNIYHYGTEQMEAGKDLMLPKWAEVLLLNSNYHNTHHKNPSVPWKKLPEVHAEKQYGFNGGFIQHGLMQLGGPILKPAG